jgi:hypothetical protein
MLMGSAGREGCIEAVCMLQNILKTIIEFETCINIPLAGHASRTGYGK